MTRREFENLREWVQHTEKDLGLLEKAVTEQVLHMNIVREAQVKLGVLVKSVSDVESDVKVLKNTQKFTGWLIGILLAANMALLSFVLYKLFELSSRIK